MAGRERNLYGVAISLSGDWRDAGEYEFDSDAPLERLSFALEDVPGKSARKWLDQMREKLGQLEQSYVGAVRNYEQRHFRAVGFEARLGDDAATCKYIAVVLLPLEARCLAIRANGASGYAEPLGHVVLTLTPDPPLPLPKDVYPVLGYAFHSEIAWRCPREFEFANGPLDARLFCAHEAAAVPYASPDWSGRFSLLAGSTLVEVARGSDPVLGRGGLRVEQRYAAVTATSGDSKRELFFAEAFAGRAKGVFHATFRCEAPADRALAEWREIASSIRVEA